MMRSSTAFVAALAAAAALTAAAGPRPAAAVDLTVTHWGSLMYGVPFAVAREKGYFADEGVDVTGFITSEGGGTTLRNALAAEVPYGEASLAAVVAAAKEGVPLTIVHSGVQSVGDILWVTRPDSDVQGIEDLEGRPVGFTSPRSVTEMLLTMALEEAGVGYDNVDARSLGGIGAGLTALKEDGVDAAPILEPIWTQMSDEFRPVFKAAELLPPITQTVGVVRTDFLEGNEDMIRGIVNARRRGVDFIYENPEEAAAILAKAYDMDPEVATEAVKNVAELEYWSRGDFDYDAMDNMVRGLQIVGAIEGDVDWSGLVDESYLPEDLAAGGG